MLGRLQFRSACCALKLNRFASSTWSCSDVLEADTVAMLGKNSQMRSTATANQLAIDLDLGGTSIAVGGNVGTLSTGMRVYGRWSDIQAVGNSVSLQVCTLPRCGCSRSHACGCKLGCPTCKPSCCRCAAGPLRLGCGSCAKNPGPKLHRCCLLRQRQQHYFRWLRHPTISWAAGPGVPLDHHECRASEPHCVSNKQELHHPASSGRGRSAAGHVHSAADCYQLAGHAR